MFYPHRISGGEFFFQTAIFLPLPARKTSKTQLFFAPQDSFMTDIVEQKRAESTRISTFAFLLLISQALLYPIY